MVAAAAEAIVADHTWARVETIFRRSAGACRDSARCLRDGRSFCRQGLRLLRREHLVPLPARPLRRKCGHGSNRHRPSKPQLCR